MQLTKHIHSEELLPPEWGNSAVIDERLPILLERIRELCGNKPMILNTWHRGGSMKYRGYRPALCTVGAVKSMHKIGKAADFDIQGMPADDVRAVIRANADELMKLGLTRIEIGINWVHVDLKYTGLSKLYEFRP